eukprot:3295931-Lingulodinium_polyedra.AAC.1
MTAALRRGKYRSCGAAVVCGVRQHAKLRQRKPRAQDARHVWACVWRARFALSRIGVPARVTAAQRNS